MDENQITVAYIDILRRSNCNSLMLLFNSYWSRSAFQQGPLDRQKILEVTKKIKTNASSILKACQVQPRRVCLKRSHQDGEDSRIKKKRYECIIKDV